MNPKKQNILVMYSTSPPSEKHLLKLEYLAPDFNIIAVESEKQAIEYAQQTTIFLGHRYLWQSIPHTQNLAWIQSSAGGIDHLLVEELYKKKPLLTRSPIFSDVIAFHAISLAFSLLRKTNLSAKDKQITLPAFIPDQVMIFGTGLIGKQIAAYLKAFACTITGINTGKEKQIKNFDRAYDYRETWTEKLPETQVLFLCAPYTKETSEIIGHSILNKLPENSCIVNVGRGQVINYHALITNLDNGKISAGLDVLGGADDDTRTRLEKLPNVILTQKTASFFPGRQEKFENFVEAQLERFISGKNLLYTVNYLRQCY